MTKQVAPIMFIKVRGRDLIHPLTQKPIILRGFNFTQNYWMSSERILVTGQDDEAYSLAYQMGANSIRLTVSHHFLEPLEKPFSYSAEAFRWLDLQISHAKCHNLFVSIALVLPHGGDWLDKKEGKNFRLWHDELLQKRFISIWKTLASRYAKETNVLGYDIFNVPITDDKSGDAYFQLLEKTIQEIRAVDPWHLIIVSKLYGSYGSIDDRNSKNCFRKLDFDNILYDYHFYDPLDYTHQYADWIGNDSDGGKYPDESILEVTSKGERIPRVKAYLNKQLEHFFDFSEVNDVPIHLGEIGLVHVCYEGKGGLVWVSDLLELLSKRGVGFFYWDFQSLAMGIINQATEDEIIPEKVNFDLAKMLFR